MITLMMEDACAYDYNEDDDEDYDDGGNCGGDGTLHIDIFNAGPTVRCWTLLSKSRKATVADGTRWRWQMDGGGRRDDGGPIVIFLGGYTMRQKNWERRLVVVVMWDL